jgi:hypothetical protein
VPPKIFVLCFWGDHEICSCRSKICVLYLKFFHNLFFLTKLKIFNVSFENRMRMETKKEYFSKWRNENEKTNNILDGRKRSEKVFTVKSPPR